MRPSLVQVASASVLLAIGVSAQTPLVERRYDWNNLPIKADTDDGVRGRQYGTNRCNATTAGQNSTCQTAVINSLAEFCLWAPPEPDSIVGNTEGEMVAWCTTDKYGTRVIPEGAITGAQFVRTPSYIQISGRINQALVNINAEDYGGEMDPIGADRRGNPLGGLVYSNAFSGGNSFQQVIYYHNFMGGGVFCLKACVPGADNQARMCEHVYDRIGCAYNAPAAYADNVFESCQGQDQLPPGIYVGGNGATSTYYQPAESLGPITSIPYTAAIPASSNCVQTASSAVFSVAAQLAASRSASSASVASASASVASASAASVSSASAASVARTATTSATAAPSSAGSGSGSGSSSSSSSSGGETRNSSSSATSSYKVELLVAGLTVLIGGMTSLLFVL